MQEHNRELIDVRFFTQHHTSATGDPEIAEIFTKLRDSNGEEYKGLKPEEASTISCDWPLDPDIQLEDGPLFKAQEMEDKWDIYYYDGSFYFTRSWTGQLDFRVYTVTQNSQVKITSIDVYIDPEEGSPELAIEEVDYLIQSHILGKDVPHPIPRDFPDDLNEIAVYSFSMFGRRATFAYRI